MKIKKLIVVMVAACMLVMSQAAYATEVSPTAVGIGDTRETAIPLTPCAPTGCHMTQLPLTYASDVDWFTWTNSTGEDKFTSVLMISPSGYSYSLGYQIKYPNGTLSSKVYAPTSAPGGMAVLGAIYVPKGAVLYLEVSSPSGVNATSLYGISLHID